MATTTYDPNFTFKYGSEENLENLDYQTGSIIFCSNGQQFVDVAGTRHRITSIIADYTEQQIHSVDGKFIPQEDDTPDEEEPPIEPTDDNTSTDNIDTTTEDNTGDTNTSTDDDSSTDNEENTDDENSGTLLGAGDDEPGENSDTNIDEGDGDDNNDDTPSDTSDDTPTEDEGGEDEEDTPAFRPYGLPVIYIASDTHNVFFYNTETYNMEELTITLARAATNDGLGNNIAETYCTKETETSDYREASDKIEQLFASIAALPKFIIRVCEDGSLPVVGEEGVLYFVPTTTTAEETVYTTYIYSVDDGYYIKIGSSSADLDNYPTKVEMQQSLATLQANLENKINNGDAVLQASIDNLSSRVMSAESTVNSVNTRVSTYDSKINSVTEKANINEENITTLNSALANDEVAISNLRTDVNTNTSKISTVESVSSANTLDIEGLTGRMRTAETNIQRLAEASSGSGETFDQIFGILDTVESNIDTISEQSNTNSVDIAELKQTTTDNTTAIVNNKTKIETNTGNISSLTSRMNTAEADIRDLKNVAKQVSTNTNNIASITNTLNTKLTYSSGELSNVDFNDYTTAGCYEVTDLSESDNYPVNEIGTLSITANQYSLIQEYVTKTNIYIRSYVDGDWTGWIPIQRWDIDGSKLVEDFGYEG